MFTKINQIIPKTLNHYNLTKVVNAAQVVNRFQIIIEELLSKEVASQTHAVSLNDHKELTITTSHNAIAQEIQLKTTEILAQLNNHFREECVKGFRFKMKRQKIETN